MTARRCAACRRLRPLSELLAFWALASPWKLFYCCRMSIEDGAVRIRGQWLPCFSLAVGSVSEHAIAPATALLERAA